MSGTLIVIQKLRVNPLTIVPHPQPKLPFVIPDFHFDPLRLCVLESIAHCLAGNPIDFVSQYRTEVPRRPFHPHMKLGSIRVRFAARQFFSQSVYRQREVVGHHRRGAQPLYGIPALGNRLSCLIDSARECFLGLVRTRWEQVIGTLETEQHPVKTLQQRIVQLAGDSHSLVDPFLHAQFNDPSHCGPSEGGGDKKCADRHCGHENDDCALHISYVRIGLC